MVSERPLPRLIRDAVVLEDDEVHILDRRCFPREVRFERCRTVDDVARAIRDMVTQSGGPFFAASAAMVLAARTARGNAPEILQQLRADAALLVAPRPTNDGVRRATTAMLSAAEDVLTSGGPLAATLESRMTALWAEARARAARTGAQAASVISDGEVLLTHCWGESVLIETLRSLQRSGRQIRVVASETRPYLQGSRLTATSLMELGVDVVVVADAAAADLMRRGEISRLITAADRVPADGSVINKTGTLAHAVAAHHFGVPYLAVVAAPDLSVLTAADVPIEERSGDEVLGFQGRRVAADGVRGLYRAFDVTPPELVTAIATERGVFAPGAVRDFARVAI